MLKVIEPVSGLFRKAVDNCTYQPIEQLARYGEDAAHELHPMAKKTDVPIKARTFSGKDPMLATTFLQDFKSPSDACGINEGAATELFKHYLWGSNKAAVRSGVGSPNSVSTCHWDVITIICSRQFPPKDIRNG